MNNSVNNPTVIALTAVNIDNNQDNNNQTITFNNRKVRICKQVLNYMTHSFMILGGVGLIIASIVRPTIDATWSEISLNASSVCKVEAETRINAYDNANIKASLIAGAAPAFILNLLIFMSYFETKIDEKF